MSLRQRTLVAFVLIAVVLVTTNVALSTTFRSFLFDRLDRQLVAATSTLAERQPGRGGPREARCLGVPGGQEALSEYAIACLDPDAGLLYRFTSPFRTDEPRIDLDDVLTAAGSRDRRAEPFTTGSEDGTGSWRVVAYQVGAGDNFVIVGLELDQLEATLRRIRAVQGVATLGVLVALAVVGWWIVQLGVRPVEAMARTATEIAAGDLSKRLEHVDPATEAGRAGAAFNTMLERITEAFRAREASEARVRQFAADASHELRTPLTSIRGYAELYRAGGLSKKADLADAMRRMEEEATRMGALVDDLLLLARLDQDRPLDVQPVRLDRLAEDAVRDARAVEPERRIELSADPVTVEGDEARLRQVIANLLANARVHTPVDADVLVRVRSEAEDRAVVEVADRGPGMSPEVVANAFERFYRADVSRSRAAGGSGLGLSIVAAIARAHGGSAAVESARGEGSTFRVELPRTGVPGDS